MIIVSSCKISCNIVWTQKKISLRGGPKIGQPLVEEGLKGGRQLVEESLKGGHQEAPKEVANPPIFKRKPEDEKLPGGLKRIRREDGKAIKDPREPTSDVLHLSLYPQLDGYRENLLPVPSLSHFPKIDPVAESGAQSNIIPTSEFLKMNLQIYDVHQENHIRGACGESWLIAMKTFALNLVFFAY